MIMNNLNSVLIEGVLTIDPILNRSPGGAACCTFCIESNRFYRRNEETAKEISRFDVEVWGKQAKYCAECFEKGKRVRVVGRLKQDRWTDGKGVERSRVKIISDHVGPKND